MSHAPSATDRPWTYEDPLDLIWTRAANELGIQIERSSEVYASWDGRQTLTLANRRDFDPDDSLAQLILHELCHALVEGQESLKKLDWGLCNQTDQHIWREHACHRLQAALLDTQGLRHVLAPTTAHRPYYDALPTSPLDTSEDPAVFPAQVGWQRAQAPPWRKPLRCALAATRQIALIVAAAAPNSSVWRRLSDETFQ